MTTAQRLINELQQEAAKNKTMLERIPEQQLSWKPHEKSMTIGRLGMHIAEIPKWIDRCLCSPEHDMGNAPYNPYFPKTRGEIISEFDRQLSNAVNVLQNATDAQLAENWRFRRGEKVIYDLSRAEVVRRQINHTIHHRGQLSVYLRLLDVPVPGTFGPSADEH